MSRVLFLLAPGVHLLDLAGPAQAFSSARDYGQAYELHYVGEQEEVPTAQGLPLRASVAWPELTADDLLFVPGWRARTPGNRTKFAAGTLRRLVDHHRRGGTVASVCAGAFALAEAGLLNGRRCTTHHDLQDELGTCYPHATVVHDVLFVVDGRVVTSAGIASGIDLALHLLATRHGPGFAARIAREMVVYARRNGDDRQESVMLRHRGHVSDAVHRVQDVIDAGFTRRLPLAELAGAGGVSERTLTRLFHRATGLTPLRYQQELRVERAEHLIGHGATVEAAARAVGFEDARMLRRLRSRAAV
ncbi:GlxA family transcriptional regulator [Hamadaea tsunoensis]|uniref:GlxA family transcriptional regulator n=1 Tax=Hamadaea tsunoensis TaxID=53368 RepID=UPI00041758D1|nr:DJ-1/PfpI family protein [Hamadaea tsunoensis]